MPELPEVETVRRGLAPLVSGHRIVKVTVRESRLRWPVPKGFVKFAEGRRIVALDRRGKYLIFVLDSGDRLLVHLGMSGRLLIYRQAPDLAKHDHVDLQLDNGLMLRFNDPRRFGAVLPWPRRFATHALTRGMGPEPLSAEFSGDHLFARSRGRSAPVKNFIMDGRVVVGAGNIYASEALFRARVRPGKPAGRLNRKQYGILAQKIRDVLLDAIKAGGTTLRDFASALGEAGDFQQRLDVYGREGQPCRRCRSPIKRQVIGGRSSFYCPSCQK